MARVPSNSYGQSQYTEQLLQTVLVPTITGGTAYSVQTTLSINTLNVGTINAANVYAANATSLGNLGTETLAVGCQSMAGTYTTNLSTTIVGIRAVGNSNVHGTFNNNVIVGAEAGLNLCNTNSSVYVGAGAGTYGQATSNVVVGAAAGTGSAGIPATTGNVYLGAGAGKSNAGNSNVFIGLNAGADLSAASNTFVVNNISSTVFPLIYGKFDTKQISINCLPLQSNALTVSGTVRLSNDVIADATVKATSFQSDISTSNTIGGVTLNYGNIVTAGSMSTGSGIFGGVTLSFGSITASGVSNNISAGYFGGVNMSSGNVSFTGSINGNGSMLTNLNGSNIASGPISSTYIPDLGAEKITSGTFSAFRVAGGINALYGGVSLADGGISSTAQSHTFGNTQVYQHTIMANPNACNFLFVASFPAFWIIGVSALSNGPSNGNRSWYGWVSAYHNSSGILVATAGAFTSQSITAYTAINNFYLSNTSGAYESWRVSWIQMNLNFA